MFSQADLDTAVKAAFASRDDIPADHRYAVVADVDQAGARIIAAERIAGNWQAQEYIDKPWSGPMEVGARVIWSR